MAIVIVLVPMAVAEAFDFVVVSVDAAAVVVAVVVSQIVAAVEGTESVVETLHLIVVSIAVDIRKAVTT